MTRERSFFLEESSIAFLPFNVNVWNFGLYLLLFFITFFYDQNLLCFLFLKQNMMNTSKIKDRVTFLSYVEASEFWIGLSLCYTKYEARLLTPFKQYKDYNWASLVTQMVKNLLAIWETWVWSLGWEDLLEKGTITHSSMLVKRITWTKEPGRLQSMGSQRVRQDWATFPFTETQLLIPFKQYKGYNQAI